MQKKWFGSEYSRNDGKKTIIQNPEGLDAAITKGK